MLDQIEHASSSIYWESYIFNDDTFPDHDFIEALINKSRQKVKVKIILDGFGSIYLSTETVSKLAEAGIEVLFFKSLFRRIHRKILIIDEESVFVGGVNVGRAYKKWFDLHLYIENRSLVKSLLWSFSRSYVLCGGKDKKLTKIKESSPSSKTKVWLLDHFPSIGKFLLREYYLEAIARAKKKIIIITPYFVPRSWLIRALETSMKRGIKVEILVTEYTDSKFMDFTNYLFMAATAPLGINFFLTKGINHAKAILIDGKEAMIGSNNIDSMSFHFNIEAGITFKDKQMVSDLKRVITDWKKESIVFDPLKFENSWYVKPLEWLIRFVSPVL